MNNKQEKAIHFFQSGLNCAQSVLNAFSEEMDFDPKLALSISCGFGGGMGRLQKTCGAVTGSFMALGVYNGKRYTDNNDRKEKTYAMIQSFSKKFTSAHGAMDCKELLNCDLTTEEGQKYARENKLYETVCEKCVADSVMFVEELIKG